MVILGFFLIQFFPAPFPPPPPPHTAFIYFLSQGGSVELERMPLNTSWSKFRCQYFMAQKSLDVQGPSLPIAIEIDLPASKSLRPATYKQLVHK
jgi:hypothetical protein